MKLIANLLLAALFVILGAFLTAKFEYTDNASAQNNQNSMPVNVNAEDNIYNSEDGHSIFAVIAKKTLPSVVSIKTERSIEYNYVSPFDRFFQSDPFFEDFFGRPPKSTPKTRKHIQRGEGSGFIYSPEGYIMTNNHVVEKTDKIIVKLQTGEEVEAELIGNDPETDLAVIKIDKKLPNGQVAVLGDSDELWAGDWVIAIGSPYSLDQTVTVGVVSAKGRSGLGIRQGPVFQDFIQTDAAINPGNSGGPLLNIKGEVVGINAAINVQAQGIGFAIPVNMAKNIAGDLKTDGIVKRAYLGIMPKEIGVLEKDALGLSEDQDGVLIASVGEGTPAEKSGLKVDDIILEMGGKKITSLDHFRFDLASYPPGTKIDFLILRRGKEKKVSVKLGDRSVLLGDAGSPVQNEPEIDDILGMKVEDITEGAKKKFNISVDIGVIVTDIAEESVFFGKLQAGDLINKIIISGVHFDIETVDDLKEIESKLDGSKSYIVRFIRNNRNDYVLIKP
ncbi:MAG: trypsin-like peptidase domain-containing protein [Candidatus Delongbacteria bacterium]